MLFPTPGPCVSFGSRCSSCCGHGCPRNARLEQGCSPARQWVGEPRGCCHGAEHRSGTGVNKEQAGQHRTDLQVPLLRDVLASPQRLRSSLPCSSPPLLMSHWEMSAGFAEHPTALSPPGCRARARGAARSRASRAWPPSVTGDISPGVTRGGQQQGAEGQRSPKNTSLPAHSCVFGFFSIQHTHC